MKNNNVGCITAGIVLIVVIILCPILYYFGGYITGMILEWLLGNTIANGLNYLFNTTRFTPDMLPITCGTLGVVGSFFKSTSTSSSKN